jgi:hypothetical protein
VIGHSERELLERLHARHAHLMRQLEGDAAQYWDHAQVQHDADIILALIALLERG